MTLDQVKVEIEKILDKFVAFLHDLVNTFLGDVKIDIFEA